MVWSKTATKIETGPSCHARIICINRTSIGSDALWVGDTAGQSTAVMRSGCVDKALQAGVGTFMT